MSKINLKHNAVFLLSIAFVLLFSSATIESLMAEPSSVQVNPLLASAEDYQISNDSSGRIIAVILKKKREGNRKTNNGTQTPGNVLHKAAQFLNAPWVEAVYGIQNAGETLRPSHSREPVVKDSNANHHVSFTQYQGQIPVLGTGLTVHMNAAGEITSVTGRLASFLSSPDFKDFSKAAKQAAVTRWQSEFLSTSHPSVLSLQPVFLTDSVFPDVIGSEPVLAWEVRLAGLDSDENYYVSADGRILTHTTNLRNVGYRRVYDCGLTTNPNGCALDATNVSYPGYIFGRSEYTEDRGPFPQTPATQFAGSQDVDALWHMLDPLHEFWVAYGGINGANRNGGVAAIGEGTNTLTHRDLNWPGACPNAGFNPSYGRLDFCRGMVTTDVVAHEYMHAVVRYTYPEGGTIYYGETASFEEASADVMGENFEYCSNASEDCQDGSNDWRNGGQSALQDNRQRNLREPSSIINPNTGLPYPDKYGGYGFYCGTANYGGAHRNATVFGKAAYLIAEGSSNIQADQPDGLFNGCRIEGQGIETLRSVLIHAWLGLYLPRDLTYNEAVAGLHLACKAIYGTSERCGELLKALHAVEMDQGDPCAGAIHSTPACVETAGAFSLMLPENSTAVAVNDWVRVAGSNLDAQRNWSPSLLLSAVDPVLHPVVYGEPIVAIEGAQASIQVVDGSFEENFWQATAAGSYVIVADGNANGIFDGSDRMLPLEVFESAIGDGICYRGQEIVENCQSAPECACGDSQICVPVEDDYQCQTSPITPGVVDAARPSQALTSLFSPGENIYALGADWGGVSTFDIYLVPSGSGISGTALPTELSPSGSFIQYLGTAHDTGFFDIVIDANSNGVFDEAFDRISSFEVRALTDGDGLCYAGERYETSENCRTQREDCACGTGRYCTSFANAGRFRCLTLQQIQWLKAHPIEEAVQIIRR